MFCKGVGADEADIAFASRKLVDSDREANAQQLERYLGQRGQLH
jgi:hypothetical protein